MNSSNTVLFKVDRGVGVVTFNRPEKHNAFNDEMSAAMGSIIELALSHVDVRCVLIRSNGASFSSGRDTTQLGQRPSGESDFEFVQRAQRTRMLILDSPKPTVVEMRGFALGGACELALSGDIRVADMSVQLAFPEVRYGIAVDTGGSALATALAGPSKAKYLMMTGERIDAATALAWNLVDFLVPPDELEARARAIAQRLADNAPLAVQMSKQLVDNVWAGSVRAAMRSELMAQTALFTSRDRAEVGAARAEGRPPEFTGR